MTQIPLIGKHITNNEYKLTFKCPPTSIVQEVEQYGNLSILIGKGSVDFENIYAQISVYPMSEEKESERFSYAVTATSSADVAGYKGITFKTKWNDTVTKRGITYHKTYLIKSNAKLYELYDYKGSANPEGKDNEDFFKVVSTFTIIQ